MEADSSVTLSSIKKESGVAGLWDRKLDAYWNTRTVEKHLEESRPVQIWNRQLKEVEQKMANEREKVYQAIEEIMKKVTSWNT